MTSSLRDYLAGRNAPAEGWHDPGHGDPGHGDPGRLGELPEAAPAELSVARLFAELWRSLYVLALGLTGSAAAAEDVVQDVFLSVQRRQPAFAGRPSAAAYLHAAVTNRCRSYHRRAYVRRRYEAALPPREPVVPDHAYVDGEHAEVLAAVGRLGRRQREVVILRYWCDLSDADTARVLDVSVSTVRSTASRAHARLASMLGAKR